MTGDTTDETDDAVQANIVAVGYKALPALRCVEVGESACYRDDVHARILGDVVMASASMTHEKCMQSCFIRKKRLAGVENGKQCMCGDVVDEPVLSTNCTAICPGSSSELCGGWLAITVLNFTCN